MISIIYKISPEILSFLEDIFEFLKINNYECGAPKDYIQFTHFESQEGKSLELENYITNFSDQYLPVNISLTISFSQNGISFINPSLHLSIKDSSLMKLYSLEEKFLDGLSERKLLKMHSFVDDHIHFRVREYLNKYGQEDILRWQKDRYKLIDFSDRMQGIAILDLLRNKFNDRSFSMEISNLFIK